MFGEPGSFYVYFVYGMHLMLNIVTGRVDYPAAILIRGVQDIDGPARLTKALVFLVLSTENSLMKKLVSGSQTEHGQRELK